MDSQFVDDSLEILGGTGWIAANEQAGTGVGQSAIPCFCIGEGTVDIEFNVFPVPCDGEEMPLLEISLGARAYVGITILGQANQWEEAINGVG